MKEIFTKIWKFLWERTGRKELDSDEIWLLERMDRIAAIEEPDYDRMWERIRRKTICKNSPRVKLWLNKTQKIVSDFDKLIASSKNKF